MSSGRRDPRREVGNLALARYSGVPERLLRRRTYVAGARERVAVEESGGVQRTDRTLPLIYAPDEADGILGHVAFAMKHETIHLGLLAACFAKLPAAEVAAYVSASPTGAYARRIGYLYELLTGADLLSRLRDPKAVAGNYVPLFDDKRMVTATPRRIARWKVDDNQLGDRAYSPTIERTAAAEAILSRDWAKAVQDAVGAGGNAELLRRALQYLFRKETKSSFAIERESPSQERANRFIRALERAGRTPIEVALSEPELVRLQNLIVDPRFAARSFRPGQNYVGGMVRWEPVVHYVSPPPALLGELMRGWAAASGRLAEAEAVAQATVAAFGFVFHHPFEDGNGRIHRFLIHDILVRRAVVPGGMALPVSSAILEDLSAYDHVLEAYSSVVGEVARYTLSDSGVLTVTNPEEASWVWRYPDLTPQVEYLGRVMERAVRMVPEEVDFLVRYDGLLRQAKQIVDMPDVRLGNLLSHVHANGGTLSRNRHKQLFRELTADEVRRIEAAYAEVFGAGGAPGAARGR